MINYDFSDPAELLEQDRVNILREAGELPAEQIVEHIPEEWFDEF